ncbi:MAG: DNA polymerase III subunit gamma/tau [Clostridiales bacterium]|nr:DNA polymerase III subunit gamma/tau [Clostridiales bacterium]
MSYRALYRTYRPNTFAQVIGQEHITTVLKNQIAGGKFAHAYLFSGGRGTGKTSTAKIFARAVCCKEPNAGEPCGVCANCVAATGGCADLAEIDAASNTGVDNVRDLIDQAQYSPLQLPYRIFIIDEVHMLSPAAFNALLKTLEEPPAHVLFILATTEPQRLPATVISRCQRFEFKRLTKDDIIKNLQTVLGSLGAGVAPNGLAVIATKADGSMRDALSLLDQCLSFCGNKLTEADVFDVLGAVRRDELDACVSAALIGDAAALLFKLDDVLQSGRDLSVFVNDLTATVRDAIFANLSAKEPDARRAEQLLYMLEQLTFTMGELRYFPAPRVLVEQCLLRVCRPQDGGGSDALQTRVAFLETRLENAECRMQNAESHRAVIHVRADNIRPPEHDAPLPAEDFALPWEEPVPPPEIEESEPEPKPESSAAATLWEQTLAALQKTNPLVHIIAQGAVAESLTADALTVAFAPGQEDKLKNAKNPFLFKPAQDALTSVNPKLALVYIIRKPDDVEERLRGVLGDVLKIE